MKVKTPREAHPGVMDAHNGAMEAHSGAAVVCSHVYIQITSMIRIRIKKAGSESSSKRKSIWIHIEMPESSELS
jgi:hypothetical protein